jgi:heme/copper-type cytochrome/quinol oxidase subunit 1
MIGEPGHWRSGFADPAKEDITMLKTISAALLGVAILAAPTLAATPAKSTAKTTQAPVAKATAQKTTAQKTTAAPVIKADSAKSKVMNANAKMHRHVRHHRHHSTSVLKKHTPKVAIKHVAPAKPAKRG